MRAAKGKDRLRKVARAGAAVVDSLEQRTMLAASVIGIPDWVEQGPGPILDGQVAGMPGNPVAGAINAIAVHPNPTNLNVVYVATVNGGVWKTTNATALEPTWTP